MQKLTMAAVTAAALGAVVLTGCSSDTDRRCDSGYTTLYFWHGTYYSNPSHTHRVPDYKLPKQAKQAPGFKPNPKTAKPPVNTTKPGSSNGSTSNRKPSVQKPAPAPKPAAPRVSGRR